MGGADAFGRRIRHGFDSGYMPHHNEPPFLVPWLAVYAGRPDLAADLVRAVLDRYTETRYPGQEDGGAMSSRYVFAVAGFFPNAGQPIYLLHGPRFARLEFRLEGDRTFVVEGRGVSDANRYVQSVVLNGEPLDRAWMAHEEIVSGGHLVFDMGPEPTSWGQSAIPPCPYPALPGEGLGDLDDPLAIQVIPNPTRDVSFIIVPVTTDRTRVTLTIYDMLGRQVRRLLARELPRGDHSVVWRGDDEAGRSVAPGIYFYEVRRGPLTASDRVIRLSP